MKQNYPPEVGVPLVKQSHLYNTMEAKATKKSFTSLASAAKNTEHGPSSQPSPSSNQKESGNLNLTKKERLGRSSKKKHPQIFQRRKHGQST